MIWSCFFLRARVLLENFGLKLDLPLSSDTKRQPSAPYFQEYNQQASRAYVVGTPGFNFVSSRATNVRAQLGNYLQLGRAAEVLCTTG